MIIVLNTRTSDFFQNMFKLRVENVYYKKIYKNRQNKNI